MKVDSTRKDPNFTPFNLVLTVETVEEARALYHVFNYAPNMALFTDKNIGDKIRLQLRKHGSFQEWTDKLKEKKDDRSKLCTRNT